MPLPICPAPMEPMDLIVVRPSAGASCCARWSKMPSVNEAGRGAVPTTGGRGCGSAQFLLQLGNRHEEVGHEAVFGNLEDRRLLVLVDGDDDLRILHAGEMLDGSGDTDGHVEVGSPHFPGLAVVVVVAHASGVDRGARGAAGGAHLVVGGRKRVVAGKGV